MPVIGNPRTPSVDSHNLLGMRVAPSNRMTTPFSMAFSMLCTTSDANSSGRPARTGNSMAFFSPARTLSDMAAVMAESNMLGATVTTRMPNRDRSRAIGSVMAATAPLLAAYATWPICPSKAAAEATMTMTPRSPSSPTGGDEARCGRTCRTRSSVPRRLTSRTRSMEERDKGSRDLERMRPGRPMPAAGMMPPRGKEVVVVQETRAETAEEMEVVEVTSHSKNLALVEEEGGREVAGGGFRSRMAACPPWARMEWTVARPRPEELGGR